MNSKLYTTGYIPETENNLRIKQGLLQQNISNICSINLTNVIPCNQQNLYSFKRCTNGNWSKLFIYFE